LLNILKFGTFNPVNICTIALSSLLSICIIPPFLYYTVPLHFTVLKILKKFWILSYIISYIFFFLRSLSKQQV